MAGSLNRVELIGNVGKDPEIKTMTNGAMVANLSVATNSSYKKDGEKVQQTEWHRVTVWQNGDRGLVTDVIQKYLTKGMLVYIAGELKTRKWEDTEGNTRYSTEVVLSGYQANLQMLTRGDSNGGSIEPGRPAAADAEDLAAKAVADIGDDEIPF